MRGANVFISPRTFSRFFVSLFFLAVPGEILAIYFLTPGQALLILGASVTIQAMPLMFLLSRTHSRKRGSEAELPFFLMTLSVFAHEANPSVQGGFRRISALGRSVFPAFYREAEILERDDVFIQGSPMSVAEAAFANHPSPRLREFVQAFLKALSAGKDVAKFVKQETLVQIQKHERSWTAFSVSVGSLAEVAFILLALFPVGLEMVGTIVSGFTSSLLFIAPFAILAAVSVLVLALTDSMQPIVYDKPPSTVWLALTISAWGLSTAAFISGFLDSREYVLIPLGISLLGFYETRKHYSIIRRGEQEVSSMLHDLAEESKAGVGLPESLSKLSDQAHKRFSSIEDPVRAFYQSTRIGLTPTEAQKRISHPSWLVRLGFGILSIAFESGAGFEHLEELSSLFRKVSDARRSVTQSMIPFMLIGAIVPVISVSAITFLAGFAQQSAPIGLPIFAVRSSQSSLILSVSTVSMLSGVLLSKLLTQTVRHQVA
ncbi:MAG: hypothetical protein OK455_00615, partial [Thaumarchaeota archaeon]|nr:hypothetical protein [Nitrososphaerota archaeon]